VENGKVVMLSGDEVSPFMMFLPTTWWRPSWLLVLLSIALVALLLTVVAWPVTALVRRHYHVKQPLAGRELAAHRWVRIAAVAVLVTVLGWGAAIMSMSSNIANLSPRFDPVIWLLHVVSLVVFVGAPLIALWNGKLVWTATRTWPAKLWSVVLVVACVSALWVALAYKLIGFSVNY
jgi:hypothetical protein